MEQKPRRMGAAEEDLLLALVARGNRSARDRLVLAHQGLVGAIAAREARRSGKPYEELFQEGMTGLLDAIERFDRTQETRLVTYATYLIAGAIKQALRRSAMEDLYPDMDVLMAPGDEVGDRNDGEEISISAVPPRANRGLVVAQVSQSQEGEGCCSDRARRALGGPGGRPGSRRRVRLAARAGVLRQASPGTRSIPSLVPALAGSGRFATVISAADRLLQTRSPAGSHAKLRPTVRRPQLTCACRFVWQIWGSSANYP